MGTAGLINLVDHSGGADHKDEPTEHSERAAAPPYIQHDADLSKISHSLLLKEQRRLEAKIGVSAERRKRYNEVSEKIVRAEAALTKLEQEIKGAKESNERIELLTRERDRAYQTIFEQIEKEEALLDKLYEPLRVRLSSHSGTISKLNVSVTREVDVAAWADEGESLLDLKRSGEFRGIGRLKEVADLKLKSAWEAGSAEEIATAMSDFREKYGSE